MAIELSVIEKGTFIQGTLSNGTFTHVIDHSVKERIFRCVLQERERGMVSVTRWLTLMYAHLPFRLDENITVDGGYRPFGKGVGGFESAVDTFLLMQP